MHISLQTFLDVTEHANGLQDWQQEYCQLEAGFYSGQTVDIRSDNLRLFREKANLAVTQKINFPDHQQHIAIPLVQTKGGLFKNNALSLFPHACSFRAYAPSNYDVLILSVERQKYPFLAHNAHQMRVLSIDAETFTLVKNEWRALTDYVRTQPSVEGNLYGIFTRKIEDGIALLLEQQCHMDRDESYYGTRRYIVDQCQAMIEASPHAPPSLMQLCRQLKISRRTLQYSFESEANCTPLHYIRALRLNAVRRRLLNSEQPSTVISAAAEQGFFHQSYFTRIYQQHFSELPSQTIKRAQAEYSA